MSDSQTPSSPTPASQSAASASEQPQEAAGESPLRGQTTFRGPLIVGGYRPAAPSGADRRRTNRIPQNRAVKIFDPVSERHIAGLTRDVSATGVCVAVPSGFPAKPGSTLMIHIGLRADGRAESIVSATTMLQARVIWARDEVLSGMRTLGLALAAAEAASADAA